MRAVLYARVSRGTPQQDPSAQLHAMRAFCTARKWRVVAELCDEVTGDPVRRKRDPAGLSKALTLIRRRTGDVLVIFALDRLVRSGRHLLDIVCRVDEWGGYLASCQDGRIDTTRPDSQLVLFVRGWFAGIERDLISARTKAALAERRAAGVQLGRPRQDLPDLGQVAELRAAGASEQGIARKLACSRWTVRRALAELRKAPGAAHSAG